MLKKESDTRSYFYCESADWSCVVLADDVDEAANKAVRECLETLGKDANVSFVMIIKKISTTVEPSDFLPLPSLSSLCRYHLSRTTTPPSPLSSSLVPSAAAG